MKRAALAILTGLILASTTRAEISPEYKLKALVVFNFAKFVDWPPQSFADTNVPIVIGILGDDPFDGVLDEIIKGRAINGRPLQVKRSRNVADLKGCQLLYVSASEKDRHAQIIAALDGLPVLTISDADQFLPRGGMVRLMMQQQKVRFSINAPAAEHAGLKVSSDLLSLAAKDGEGS